MPPPWGRPPEGLDPRARREWERHMQEYELHQHRFEEVDSDDESVSSQQYARYMGYEGPSKTQAVPVHAYAKLAYGDGYDPEDEYERSAEWQQAMREKEEELAERALRRIRRARLRGDPNVHLSREELDALERRQQREEQERRPPARAPPPEQPTGRSRALSNASAKPQAKRKSSAGLFGMGGGSPKTKPGKNGRVVSPTDDERLPPTSSSSSLQRLNGGSPRASRKSSRTRMPQQVQQPPYDLPPNYRPSSSRSSRRLEVSPTRSLPDDPDWAPPRSRSGSNAHLYALPPPQSAPGAGDPFAYQLSGPAARRHVSDPASNHSIAYSSVRRNPPRAAARGQHMDVIDISDDEEEEDELAAEDEGGVRVDVLPEGRGGYRVQQKSPPANAGIPRARRGGKVR